MADRLTREQIEGERAYLVTRRLADTALSLMDENERLKLTLGSIRAGFHPNTWNSSKRGFWSGLASEGLSRR